MSRDRMLAAAVIIAREAQLLASTWSVQVPPSMRVQATSSTATISSGVGPSYPNEVIRVRHPVFGGRNTSRPWAPWVTNEHRPFLAPAADAKADEAAQEIAKVIDDIARRDGFT
jgi:hypothetical protein